VIFERLAIDGAFVIDIERREDDRGFFARTFCTDELAAHGLDPTVAQISVSYSRARGTLRGMHLQAAPHEETKLLRCVRGAVYDVFVDLRPDSPSFLRHVAVELTADDHRAVYVPRSCAHGFLTLEDDTEVEYVISTPHTPAAEIGLRWDDPGIGITWPFEPVVIAERDRTFPSVDLERLRAEGPVALRPRSAGAAP
jgi:dTDP-4-dehydrorhamnose 3,5-epimerase